MPILLFRLNTEVQSELVEQGNEDFWKTQASVDQLPLMKQMDVFIGIRASENIYEQSQASKNANKAYSEQFLTPVHFDERVNNTRWCIMRYPSPAFAMNAKLPTNEFTQFYYDACLVDYGQLKKMEPLEKRLRAADQVRLKGEGTDITFGERAELDSCFGRHNIPDGEIFSSPIIDSVQGISYAPSVYQGKPFEFALRSQRRSSGRFDSSNNDALRDILDTDEGLDALVNSVSVRIRLFHLCMTFYLTKNLRIKSSDLRQRL